jgi:hypothetical protein
MPKTLADALQETDVVEDGDWHRDVHDTLALQQIRSYAFQ